jgi:hypothetical protein
MDKKTWLEIKRKIDSDLKKIAKKKAEIQWALSYFCEPENDGLCKNPFTLTKVKTGYLTDLAFVNVPGNIANYDRVKNKLMQLGLWNEENPPVVEREYQQARQ